MKRSVTLHERKSESFDFLQFIHLWHRRLRVNYIVLYLPILRFFYIDLQSESRESQRAILKHFGPSLPHNHQIYISSLCPWERHLTLISHWGQAVYPSWWPSPTKDLQIEPQKGCPALAWQTYAACLVHTNERTNIVKTSDKNENKAKAQYYLNRMLPTE